MGGLVIPNYHRSVFLTESAASNLCALCALCEKPQVQILDSLHSLG